MSQHDVYYQFLLTDINSSVTHGDVIWYFLQRFGQCHQQVIVESHLQLLKLENIFNLEQYGRYYHDGEHFTALETASTAHHTSAASDAVKMSS